MNEPTRIDLGFKPRAWQAEALAMIATHRFVCLVCHRRAGKTHLVLNLLVLAALAMRDGRFAFVAPDRAQAKRIAWTTLKQICEPLPSVTFKESELTVEFGTGSRLTLFSGEDHSSIRGLGFDGLCADEAAEYPADAMGSIFPTLADRAGWFIAIGTPRGMDLLHTFYERGQDSAQPDWGSARFPADETGIFTEAQLEAERRNAPSAATFEREFLASFEASVDEALISLGLAKAAMKRNLRPNLRNEPKVVGVDVARFGSDATVFFKRYGPLAFRPTVLRGLDNMQVVGHLSQLLSEWEPNATFIDVGGGQGVIDRLNQLGFDVTAVDFGSKAIAGGHRNRRSEMWDGLRKWLERPDAMLPDSSELLSDVTAPRFSFDASNRLQLESKDQIKQRLGRSPDLGDALCLTFAAPVSVPFEPDPDDPHPYRGQQIGPTMVTRHDYNPFESV